MFFTAQRSSPCGAPSFASTPSSITSSYGASPPAESEATEAIGFTSLYRRTDSLTDILSTSPGSFKSSCAYPSWPTTHVLNSPAGSGRGSSYISDEDLFGLDDLDGSLPFLSEAPAPPREAHEYIPVAPATAPQDIRPVPVVQLQQQHQPLPPLRPRPVAAKKSPAKKATFRRVPRATNLCAIREASGN